MNDTEIEAICARIAELCGARRVVNCSIQVDGGLGAGESAHRFRLATERSTVELYLPKRYINAYAQGAVELRRLVDEALQGAVMLLTEGARRHRP
jgi:hypothetical protein